MFADNTVDVERPNTAFRTPNRGPSADVTAIIANAMQRNLSATKRRTDVEIQGVIFIRRANFGQHLTFGAVNADLANPWIHGDRCHDPLDRRQTTVFHGIGDDMGRHRRRIQCRARGFIAQGHGTTLVQVLLQRWQLRGQGVVNKGAQQTKHNNQQAK